MRNKVTCSLFHRSSLPCIYLVLVLALFSSQAIADEITIVADEWSPYNAEPNSENPGYGIEIAQKVFEAAGHTVVYRVLPWARAILEVRSGKYSAVIGAYKEEAPDFVFPEEEFGVSKNVFFAKQGSSWVYKDLESLENLRIGAIKGYSYGEELDRYLEEHPRQIQYVHGEDPLVINIRKLLAGRVDALIEDMNVLSQKAKELNVAEQIVNAGGTGTGDNVYIAFSPAIAESQGYARIFTEGIQRLKDSGELDTILSKYGLTYWK